MRRATSSAGRDTRPDPVIIRGLECTLARPPLLGKYMLLVDHTGCGRPVVDQIRHRGLECLAVSLHGGDSVSHVGSNYRVPKRDLAGAVQVTLQAQRLRLAEALALTPILTQELLNFRVKIDPATAHDSYSAWREKDHDDLVLALALAVWWGERLAGDRVPGLDLRPGLDGLHTPRHWHDPMASTRPGWPGRLWRDEYEDL